MNLNLSASQLQGVAALASPISAAASIAASAAQANIGTQSVTRETSAGQPISIPDVGHLKLLYQLHSGEQNSDDKGMLSEATHNLSYFTSGTKSTPYPYSFHEPDRTVGYVAKTALKQMFKQGWVAGLAMGVAGCLLGGPIGGLLGVKLGALHGLLLGAEIGAGRVLPPAACTVCFVPSRTRTVPSWTRCRRSTTCCNGKGVNFQQERVQNFSLPIAGNFNWNTPYGQPSTVHSVKELAVFSKMQNQTQPPPADPAKK